MTQKQKIIHQLNLHGEISRNWCLENYISRLGAIIGTLKKEGWVFQTSYKKTKSYYRESGHDYIYKVTKKGGSTLPPAFKPKKEVEEETNLKLL